MDNAQGRACACEDALMPIPPLDTRSALPDDGDDEIAGFAPACASCGGVTEPVRRGTAAWWLCHRCGLARIV